MIVCVDWSSRPAARAAWSADSSTAHVQAQEAPSGGWTVGRLLELQPEPALIAFDAPLGLPRSYLGGTSFPEWLERLPDFLPAEAWTYEQPFVRPRGRGSWKRVEAAAAAAQISLKREVDLHVGAESMFKLIGAKQVGLGALSLWRELADSRRSGARFSLWPFEEPDDGPVIAEIYPRVLYPFVVSGPVVKSDPAARKRLIGELAAEEWLQIAEQTKAARSDDEFDACLSAAALLRIELDQLVLATMIDRDAEGAILGV